ncbi:nucleotide exchange factor GrpE [Pelistega suis]|uniref:nucleotide exchange factor GrpE n=1 Tax=Pelistega suis TaxID=1631957 RepID=UPI00211CDD23|nr:nucleotide exchange factor GrpE [Pelistega suis]MCQ9329075.1 nucleotide exchange factor GrpE [Pelistega suis]
MSQESTTPETNAEQELDTQSPVHSEVTEEVIQDEGSEEQKLIGELQQQVLDLKDQVLRAHAEMENIRRRSQEEVSKARKFGTESFAESLIPVKDSLEAALAVENQALETLKEGMETTLRQLVSAFERNQLKEIAPATGDKFDPNVHQAISSVPNAEVEANAVVQTLQKGYTIAERVLRPALVIVSAG